MGFIDYHGTKENRYTEVVEYAEAQQEEEARRKEDVKVAKWLTILSEEENYSTLTINETLKLLIAQYKKLCGVIKELCDFQNKDCDEERLWNDFCSNTVASYLVVFGLSDDKRVVLYTSFMEKIFKINGYTSANVFYKAITENAYYKRYANECFDTVGEKQYWKHLGENGNKKKLEEFVSLYFKLCILIGYYLYQGLRPENDLWMKKLDMDKKILANIKADYSKGKLKNPNHKKLVNPLYSTTEKSDFKLSYGKSLDPEEEKIIDVPTDQSVEIEKTEEVYVEQVVKPDPVRHVRPTLDRIKFEKLLNGKQLLGYVEACRMLRNCELPEEMDNLYQELILRIPILQESITKFQDVYQPDLYQFYEYYIPEALQITATYIEYLDAGIGENILNETNCEVMDAVEKLLVAINEKIDEIYRYASIYLKAKAKAVESVMTQDGYVNPEYKIGNDGGK